MRGSLTSHGGWEIRVWKRDGWNGMGPLDREQQSDYGYERDIKEIGRERERERKKTRQQEAKEAKERESQLEKGSQCNETHQHAPTALKRPCDVTSSSFHSVSVSKCVCLSHSLCLCLCVVCPSLIHDCQSSPHIPFRAC